MHELWKARPAQARTLETLSQANPKLYWPSVSGLRNNHKAKHQGNEEERY